jgi:hypothetical protein
VGKKIPVVGVVGMSADDAETLKQGYKMSLAMIVELERIRKEAKEYKERYEKQKIEYEKLVKKESKLVSENISLRHDLQSAADGRRHYFPKSFNKLEKNLSMSVKVGINHDSATDRYFCYSRKLYEGVVKIIEMARNQYERWHLSMRQRWWKEYGQRRDVGVPPLPEPSKPCDFGTSKHAEQVRSVIEPVKPELEKPKSVPIPSAPRHDRGGMEM